MQNKVVMVLVILLVLASGYFLISNSNRQTSSNDSSEKMTQPTAIVDDQKVDESLKGMDAPVPSPSDKKLPADTPTADDQTTMMDKGEPVTFEVSGGAFYFDPKEIKVKEGDTVKIVFTNAGGMHDWVVDEFEARTPILKETGETAEITFVADKVGTFEYYCSVGSHRANGMVGNLVVEAK